MRAAILTIALVLIPDWAQACAACGFGEDESRIAYIGTTAFLSFLPLVLIGGGVLYYWLHHLRTEKQAAEAREPAGVRDIRSARTRSGA